MKNIIHQFVWIIFLLIYAGCNATENNSKRVGDMIMTSSQYSSPQSGHQSGRREQRYRWTNGEVPYKIDDQRFTNAEKSLIRDSINTLNEALDDCVVISLS